MSCFLSSNIRESDLLQLLYIISGESGSDINFEGNFDINFNEIFILFGIGRPMDLLLLVSILKCSEKQENRNRFSKNPLTLRNRLLMMKRELELIM